MAGAITKPGPDRNPGRFLPGNEVRLGGFGKTAQAGEPGSISGIPSIAMTLLPLPKARLRFGGPFRVALLVLLAAGSLQAEEPFHFHETFDDFDASRFRTKIPNPNTEVREGVLWTRGESGGKYPPMVYLDVAGQDLDLSFRYRHREDGGMVWFFVDGDDGFGSVDHLLRVKLLRNGVQLQVDAHSLDPDHPDRLNRDRPADRVSGAYRLNRRFPLEKVELSANTWRTVALSFRGKSVEISVDGETWRQTLEDPGFAVTKRKLLWMHKGGEKGIEIDDIRIREVVASGENKSLVSPPKEPAP